MVFSSATFLFAFLPVTLLLYYVKLFPGNEKRELSKKNIILLVSSLLFYAWGEPVYILLMLLSIFFNYLLGLDIEIHRDNTKNIIQCGGAQDRSIRRDIF